MRKKDEYFENFTCHRAISYTMERIPAINLKDIQFFLPMVGGAIDGYYKVDKVYIGSLKGNACLKLNLSTYISLGDKQVKIYGSKMQPGELISENLMRNLYGIWCDLHKISNEYQGLKMILGSYHLIKIYVLISQYT